MSTTHTINKNTIINYLQKHKADFTQKYNICKIGLFGSYATENNDENSDVDIVYETSSRGLTFRQLTQFEEELCTVFGKNIDLVNLLYMNPLIKRKASKDIIYV